MAIKGYSIFPNLQDGLMLYSGYLVVWDVLPLCRDAVCVFSRIHWQHLSNIWLIYTFTLGLTLLGKSMKLLIYPTSYGLNSTVVLRKGISNNYLLLEKVGIYGYDFIVQLRSSLLVLFKCLKDFFFGMRRANWFIIQVFSICSVVWNKTFRPSKDLLQ